MREIVNAILYRCRTGCRGTICRTIFRGDRRRTTTSPSGGDGTNQNIHNPLRWQDRERAGRSEDPSLLVPDTQSVHAAVNVPARTSGKDRAKKGSGRKLELAANVLGLVIAVVVIAASAHENRAGTVLLDRVAAPTATVSKALVDQGFKGAVVAHGAPLAYELVHGRDRGTAAQQLALLIMLFVGLGGPVGRTGRLPVGRTGGWRRLGLYRASDGGGRGVVPGLASS